MFDEGPLLWIHLGGLPQQLTEGDLACILSQYGEILEISLSQQDEESTKSCFIKYKSISDCDRAVRYLHGTTLLGSKIDVIYADESRTKRKRPPQKEVNEKTQDTGCSVDCDSGALSEDDLITSVRDQHLTESKSLFEHVNLSCKTKSRTHCETFRKETQTDRKECRSSLNIHPHSESSYSTRSGFKHRDSHSPTRSSRIQNRTPSSFEKEPSELNRHSYSPHSTHHRDSSTVYRYREDSYASEQRILSSISPIRWSRTRNSSSPTRGRILSPSSPSERRFRHNRDYPSPKRRHDPGRSSPHRECEGYHHHEYVRASHHYNSRHLHYYVRASNDYYRRSNSRCYSRSPHRERSKSRHRSSSQLRDRSRRNHKDLASRSPSSSGQPDRVSSTSRTRSRSCQRDYDTQDAWISYYREQIDNCRKFQQGGRNTPSTEVRNEGVSATGISLTLERRLSRHHETNGI